MAQATTTAIGPASFPDEALPGVCCPNCGSTGVRSFYHVHDVPIHDCLLLKTQDEALTLEKRDVKLTLCPACGFIFNSLFEPEVLNYGGGYEETQGFSPTFNKFAQSLATRIIDRYNIRNQLVLEIGCGKGEFLALLCELGPNRGIGIDPAFVPERMTSPAADRIEWIRDFYDESTLHLAENVECVVCRHTLEHIPDTADFLELVHRPFTDRCGTTVFFELPDVGRILREGAFWDIFYEHCSYFTPGSLARLFRTHGFNVIDLELDYNDQYILIAGQPCGGGPLTRPLALENDLEQISADVHRFKKVCAESITKWRDTIHTAHARGARIIIWGAGSKGVSFLTTLGITDEIHYAVDVNPHKHGMFMPGTGQEIVAPEFLSEYRPTHVIVMNPIYCDEIGASLTSIGVEAELLPA